MRQNRRKQAPNKNEKRLLKRSPKRSPKKSQTKYKKVVTKVAKKGRQKEHQELRKKLASKIEHAQNVHGLSISHGITNTVFGLFVIFIFERH